MFKNTRLGWTTLLLASAAPVVFAQTSITSGSFMVKLTDQKNAAIKGATVTIVSPQVTRTAVTGDDGQARFGLLSPGSYKITVAKAGYQSVSQTQTIRTNETTFVNFNKVPLEQSQIVEVVATKSQAVDITSATSATTTGAELISALPIGRDVLTVARFAAGVVDSPDSGGLSISGASGIENSFVLDGLSTNNPRSGAAGTQMPPEFVEQVEIQTGGFKPEFSALGGVVNIVSKSGSNSLTGSFSLTTNLPGIEAKPFEGYDYTSIGGNPEVGRQTRSASRQEYVATIGGPILQDKLFFFVGATGYSQNLPGDANPNTNIEGKNLQASDQKRDRLNSYIKLDYYPTTDSHLTFALQRTNDVTKPGMAYRSYGDAQWGSGSKTNYTAWTLNYDWTVNANLFLTAKVGSSNDRYTDTPMSNEMLFRDRLRMYYNDPAKPRGIDYYRGGFGFYEKLNDATTDQYRVDLSWFAGAHNVKVGFQYSEDSFKEISGYSGDPGKITPYLGDVSSPVATSFPSSPYGYTRLDWFSGAAQDGVRFRWYGQNAKVKSKFTAVYLQDTWEIMEGLRATYGARFEGQEHLDANGKTFFDFKNMGKHAQPRLSLVWDVNGDQRTKLSFNVAKYYERIPLQPTMRQGGREYYLDNFYTASKFHYNRTDGSWTLDAGAKPDKIVDYAVNFAAPPQMDNLRLPARSEYQLGFAHTFAEGSLLAGWTAQTTFRFRRLLDVMEDTVITDRDGEYTNLKAGAGAQEFGYAIMWNPTPGRVSWTDKNGVKVTADWTPYPEAQNLSRTWEASLSKSTERYTINLSYTFNRFTGNYEGLGAESNGQLDANITASWDYWPYVGTGTLPLERRHLIKGQGTYNWTLGQGRLLLGLAASIQSGQTRTFWTNGDANHLPDIGGYGDAIPLGMRLGDQGTQPRQTNLDGSLEYEMKVGKRFRIAPKIEIFNVMNNRQITRYSDYMQDNTGLDNATFNQAIAKKFGRNYRFTCALRF